MHMVSENYILVQIIRHTVLSKHPQTDLGILNVIRPSLKTHCENKVVCCLSYYEQAIHQNYEHPGF